LKFETNFKLNTPGVMWIVTTLFALLYTNSYCFRDGNAYIFTRYRQM